MPDFVQVQARVRQARRDVDRRAGEARALALSGQQTVSEVKVLETRLTTYERVATLLNTIGEERQAGAQRQIESLVTLGLQTIFAEDLSFHLVASESGKAATVDFMVRTKLKDGTLVDTPVMEARGGGLAATVGFLIRLVVLLLSHRADSTMFLDESFAHLSAEYEPRLAEFLRELVDKTGVQIVMVTHSSAYSDQADKVYRFTQVDGYTKVVEGSSA